MSNHFGLAITSAPPEHPGVLSLDAATLAWVEQAGVTHFSWSSQSGGFFAGRERPQYASKENERRRDALTRVGSAAGVRPAAVLARWSAMVSPHVVPIMGSGSPARLRRRLIDAVDASIDPVVAQLIETLDPSGSLGRALIVPGAW